MRWTVEEKVAIIEEAEVEGVMATLRKYGIYASTYYSWKRRYDSSGVEGLKAKRTERDPEFKRLREENRRLKELLADKELELSIKESLLKKHSGERRQKRSSSGVHRRRE